MSGTETEAGWVDAGPEGRLRTAGRTAAVGVPTGILGGFGLFLLSQPALSPVAGPALPIAFVGLAGAYAHLLSARLRRSVATMLCAFVAGIGVHLGTYLAPLWVLSYPTVARRLLLPRFLLEALAGVVLQYTLVFFAGYVLAVVTSAYAGA